MRLIDAYAWIVKMGQPVFQTRDVAACLKISNVHASKVLARLGESGQIVRLTRALWAFPEKVNPLMLPQYLADPSPCYISLQSALYCHGMISQIPVVTYAVSLARTRRIQTPLGMVSIHHIEPSFFMGFETTGRSAVRIATPEKALLDMLYLIPAKSKLFRALPEIALPDNLNMKSARMMIDRIKSLSRRTLVARRFESLIGCHLR